MKMRITFLLVAAMAVSAVSGLMAQDLSNPLMPAPTKSTVLIGPVFGYNRSMHTVDLASFDENTCPRFSNGQDNGIYFGLSWEQPLGEAKESTSSIITRVLYSTLPSTLSVTENPLPTLATVQNTNEDKITDVGYQHNQKITYSVASLEVCYKLNPFTNAVPLGFTLGPTFDFALSKKQRQTFEITSPNNARFKRLPDAQLAELGYTYENNDRTLVIRDGDIPNSQSFRLGLKAGVQYEILMNEWLIVPAMYYNLALVNLSSAEDWRVNALQIGVDVRYSFKF